MSNNQFKQYDVTVRKVLSVSREEMKRREAEWKQQHQGRKAGRKPRTLAEQSQNAMREWGKALKRDPKLQVPY